MNTTKFVVKVIPVSLDKESLEIEKSLIENGYNFSSVVRMLLKRHSKTLLK